MTERTETQTLPKKELRTIQPNALPTFPKWASKRVLCKLTEPTAGRARAILKQKKIRTRKQIFYWGKHAYLLDPEYIAFWGKLPEIYYDVNIVEPMITPGGTIIDVYPPIDPQLFVQNNSHSSVKVERILKQDVVRQGLNAIRDNSQGFNWMVLIMLLLGFVMGIVFGSSGILHPVTSAVGVHT